jgi:acyl-CoA reductase-like NAD-dependent aldehyde dehydrogenase
MALPSGDAGRLLRAAENRQRLKASTVMVNDDTAVRVDWMPFAGLGESGLGEGGIPQTMRDMRVQKTVIMRSTNA